MNKKLRVPSLNIPAPTQENLRVGDIVLGINSHDYTGPRIIMELCGPSFAAFYVHKCTDLYTWHTYGALSPNHKSPVLFFRRRRGGLELVAAHTPKVQDQIHAMRKRLKKVPKSPENYSEYLIIKSLI